MDLFVEGCQGLGLALAVGAIGGALVGARPGAGPAQRRSLAIGVGDRRRGALRLVADPGRPPGVAGLARRRAVRAVRVLRRRRLRRRRAQTLRDGEASPSALARPVLLAALALAGLSLLFGPIALHRARRARLPRASPAGARAQRKHEGLRMPAVGRCRRSWPESSSSSSSTRSRPRRSSAAIAEGAAPTFAQARSTRGTLVRDCVSTFPSVTPVATSEICTGVGPDRHWIPGMNWYHRVERRYVEYGTSLEATRAFGLFRCLYDTVYNMNMSHLSHEVETVYETLMDAGVRTAVTPFLIYRGRTAPRDGPRGAAAPGRRRGELPPRRLGPRRALLRRALREPPRPLQADAGAPGTRDEYSACVGKELVEKDLFDFMLFSLPDHDYHSHRLGPDETLESIAHADASLEQIVAAGGGMDAFLRRARRDPDGRPRPDAGRARARRSRRAARRTGASSCPTWSSPSRRELAVSPTSRAANVYVLAEGRRRARAHAAVRDACRRSTASTSSRGSRRVATASRSSARASARPRATDSRPSSSAAGPSCASGRGPTSADRRGNRWDVEGDPAALAAEVRDGRLRERRRTRTRSTACGRRSCAPHAGDVSVSLEPRLRVRRLGRRDATSAAAATARSHAGDSLGPLLTVGVEPATAPRPEQWTLRDVARPGPEPLRRRGRARGGGRGRMSGVEQERRSRRRAPAAPATPRPAPPTGPGGSRGGSTSGRASPPTGCSCSSSASSARPATSST